jgi:hypothetical protein
MAEIVHEKDLPRDNMIFLLESTCSQTPLRKTLGEDEISRTIENAFLKVEEKYATPDEGQKGD